MARGKERAGRIVGQSSRLHPSEDSRNASLGAAIRRLRCERGLSIMALGEAAETHRSYIALLEQGQRRPGWEKLCDIVGGLGVPLSRFAEETEADPAWGLPRSAPLHRTRLIRPAADDLARALAGLRLERGITVRALGEAAGLHSTTIYKIEHCDRLPTWPILCDLADGLDLPVSLLIAKAEDEATLSDEDAIARYPELWPLAQAPRPAPPARRRVRVTPAPTRRAVLRVGLYADKALPPHTLHRCR